MSKSLRRWNILMLPLIIGLGGLPLKAQETGDKPVVAVLNFSATDRKFYLKEIATSFPIKLKTELSRHKELVLVERQKLDDILKEQDFSMSDLSEDKDKQARVGQLLGADYLITGDISESGGKIRIDAAITHTASGKITGEKVIGPSKDFINAMAEMMAQNIVFNLTGEGMRVEKRTMQGKPSTVFFISTVALGAGTAFVWKTHQNWYDKYKNTTRLDRMNRYYNKAQKWYRASSIVASATAVSLSMYLYAIINNKTTDRQLIAVTPESSHPFWVVTPQWDVQNKNASIELTFRFSLH